MIGYQMKLKMNQDRNNFDRENDLIMMIQKYNQLFEIEKC